MSDDARLLSLVTVANPPAGVGGFVLSIPAGQRWKIRSFHANLVASATAGNRIPYIVYNVGGQTVAVIASSIAVVGGATVVFTWSIGSPNWQSAFNLLANQFLPDLWLPPGAQIQLQTQGILAGDQWSQLNFAVEKG